MNVIQKTPYLLVVKTESIFATIFGFSFVLLAGLAAYSYITYSGTIQKEIFYGQAFTAVTLLLMLLVFFEKSVFEFDRLKQQVRWRKQTVFKRHQGMLRFDAIRSIAVQTSNNDESQTMRVAIISESGTIPLTRVYSGNIQHMIQIAGLLNRWVLNQSPDLIKQSIRNSLVENRRVDAAMMLRNHYPLSMTEAKQFLDSPEKLDTLPTILPSIDSQHADAAEKETLLGIVALITMIVGPLLLILGYMDYIKGTATQNWLPANAVITDSGLRRETESDEYKFHLSYSYHVKDARYESNQLYIGSTLYSIIPKFYLSDQDVVKAANYRTGNTITIYYDPEAPQSSVVLPGVHGGTRTQIIFGIAGLLIYLYLARRDLHRRARIKSRKTHPPHLTT